MASWDEPKRDSDAQTLALWVGAAAESRRATLRGWRRLTAAVREVDPSAVPERAAA